MGELYRMLGQSRIDDDYLTGLSNKGTVKRAYKDMESADIKICGEAEDGLNVAVDDVTCRLLMPLGESTCSCPSRSMCRHIITAVLYVKQKYGAEQSDDDVCREKGDGAGTTSEEEQTEDFSELLDYPLSEIKKQIGVSGLRNVYEHLTMDDNASINESSIVNIELTERNIRVKLLVPIAYSTCSCGRKGFCVHRAEAILRYQIFKGKIHTDNISEVILGEEAQKLDRDGITALAESVKQLLAGMISTGLARLSPELVSSCERFAIMCHNERLADFEKDFRVLSEQLRLYFGRHASFRLENLLFDIVKLYIEANHIAHISDEQELYRLTERMRTEYVFSKPLDLVGMGYRHFKSQTGYEGITVYFFEEHTGKCYTYTNARPMYYEGRRANRMTGKENAPWGLSCSMEEMAQSRIRLSGCRVNQEGRLSSTSEAKAEIKGARNFASEGVEKNSYRDFSKLFSEKFPDGSSVWERREREGHVLVYPDSVQEAFFDSVRQRFLMTLLDAEESRIQVQIDYSSEESYNIKYLERISRQISEKKKKPACFFGRVYISGGMLKLYPIEYYEEEAEKKSAFFGGETARKAAETGLREQEDGTGCEEETLQTEGLRECLEDCGNLMTQILQSGFTAVTAGTLEDIRQIRMTALQYGLAYAADRLGVLADELEKRKHDMRAGDEEALVAVFAGLNQYIAEALSKVKYDEAAFRYDNYKG